MSWSTRRQIIIFSVIIVVVLATLGFFSLPYIFKAPTCTDGKQNQGESGADCGGPCVKVCVSQVNELKIIWTRTFKVTEGVYDTLSYVENQNFDAALKKIIYKFSLYDADNILVAERVGKTYITPNGKIPIFEGGIRTGERIPRRALFEFAEAPDWIKIPDKASSFSLATSDIKFETVDSRPVVSSTIINKSIYAVSDVEVTAILYDERDNAIAVSRTTIDSLSKGSSQGIVFTWLLPLDKPPARIEIIPRADIFSINF